MQWIVPSCSNGTNALVVASGLFKLELPGRALGACLAIGGGVTQGIK
jgi:hypothetical protein